MKTIRDLPSLEYLKECFLIDSSSPSGLIWNERPRSHFADNGSWKKFNDKYKGKPSGGPCSNNSGYFRVGINGINYMAHRIVYAIHNQTIDFKDLIIDHINRDHSDNSPENLRAATIRQNNGNATRSQKTYSGHPNVTKNNNGNWLVRFHIEGKTQCFGTYKTIEEASARAREVSLELYGQFSPFHNEPPIKKNDINVISYPIPTLNHRFPIFRV